MKECPACGACYTDTFNHCGVDGKALRHSLRGDLILDGRYKLERRLGQGGMGIVYKAGHVFLKTTHAVKVILPDLVGNDPMLGTRFRQEAMVAASIVHKNIVRVTDFGMAHGEMPYLVMEFLQGKSLHDLLHQYGRLSEKLALEIMEPITAGVGAAHRQTIIHRDLKPLNIFIQEGLQLSDGLKILDFGLAKIKSEDLLGSFVQARTTSLMGSPHYMAPEQWSEGEPDARADVYSLAVMLYEMLAGEPPFSGQSMPEIMKKVMMDRPAPFALRGVQVAPALEAAICRALEKDPKDRPASTEDFMVELREAVGSEVDMGASGYEQTLAGVGFETITEQFDRGSITHEDLSLIETQKKAESEAERLMRELEEAQSRAEEARRRVEEAARKRAEEEEARKRAEAEAARKLAEEEAARKRAEEEAQLRAQEEGERKRAEEEAARRAAEAEARKRAQEEEERRRALEEANRLAREVEAVQRRAEEARQRAEAEAEQRAKEEAARKAAEERAERLARQLEEAQSRAEEAGRRVEEAARKHAEQEEARQRAEAEAARKLAEEEATRRRAEEESRLRAQEAAEQKRAEEEAARKLAEAEARKRAEEEEEERRLALEEANRLAREVEAVQRRAEEARQRAEAEAQQRAKEEAARKAAEEKAERLARELEEARIRAEKARERVEEVASKRAEQEEAQRRAEAEAERNRTAEEQARKLETAEAQRKAQEEVARKLAEAEAARKLAEEEARKLALEEANRLKAQEEANRLAREVDAAQRGVEEARVRAQKEAEQRAKEEAARKAAEEKAERLTREVEEARKRVEEQARKHAEEETARQHAEQEARQRQAEAEAQRQAQEEAERKQAEEEANRFAREVEEARSRAEAAGQRAEELARMRADDEAARRRAEEEALRLAREVEDARRRIEEARARAEQEAAAAAEARSALSSQASMRNTLPSPGATSPEVIGVPPPKRTLPLVLSLLVVVLLALPIGGYVIYRATRPTPQPPVPARPKTVKSDMVQIPGGTFMMGRDDAPKSDWESAQRPAHAVTIKPFLMDRTEVTNAEYADFVQQTGYSPPANWSGKNPPAGQEKWPVTNVSLDDADKFAVWRSTRDGVKYRLPTEEEWEYAGRSGAENLLYPWGNNWCDDCANLGTGKGEKLDHAEPVGSHPQGANRWGVVDLIGNVWEWTSSPASFYDGSPMQQEQRGGFVIRGGSHQSLYGNNPQQRGGKEFPATLRSFQPRDKKHYTLGFRLVREAS